MLQCGRDWRPTLVARAIEALPTSTRVVKVATDCGTAFLKGMGNPAGTDSLALELVCAELAHWFGLRTPDFSVLASCPIEIEMAGGGLLQPGPVFLSRDLRFVPFGGSDAILRRLRRGWDLSRLIVFDTWIRNGDRCHPDPDYLAPNRDNVFFTPEGRKYDLVVLDHSHCFVETTLEDELGLDSVLHDERIYGLFPEFRPFVQARAIEDAAARLRQIDGAVAAEIVNSLPLEWGPTGRVRAEWCDLICRRAAFVAAYLPPLLIEQPELEI